MDANLQDIKKARLVICHSPMTYTSFVLALRDLFKMEESVSNEVRADVYKKAAIAMERAAIELNQLR